MFTFMLITYQYGCISIFVIKRYFKRFINIFYRSAMKVDK